MIEDHCPRQHLILVSFNKGLMATCGKSPISIVLPANPAPQELCSK